MDNRRDFAEEHEEDMFFNAGRAANYAEQYSAPTQRLKDTLSGNTKNNEKNSQTANIHDDITLQKQLNKQQQQQQIQQQSTNINAPIRTTSTLNNLANSATNASIINQNVANMASNRSNSLVGSIPSSDPKLPTFPSVPVISPSTLQSQLLNSVVATTPTNNTNINEAKTLPTLTSPGVIGVVNSNQKRKISLQYLAEISNFSRKDVQDAMISKIDNDTGEIYGNIPDIMVGVKHQSRMDLLDSKIHTDLQSDICTNGNYTKPAPSVIIYDTQEIHEDRGAVVLYSIPCPNSTLNTPPPIKGTPCEALAQNSIFKIPVRVVRGSYEYSKEDNQRNRNSHCPTHGYRYDGIYFVGEYFYEPEALSYVFKLIRIYGQPQLPHTPTFNLSEPPPPSTFGSSGIPQSSSNTPPSQNFQSNNPNDRKLFGIPSFVTQRILSGSKPEHLQQSTQNRHEMPFIPKIPQGYSSNNSFNPVANINNPHSLPSIPSMPSMLNNNYNRPNFPPSSMNRNTNNLSNNNNFEPQQQQMRQNMGQSFNTPFQSSSSSSDMGMGLSHTSVRQMINNLKYQNSNFGGRIQSYSYNISELNSKVEDVQKSMPSLGRQLTSRNKTFTWKLGQEPQEFDRSKYFVYDDDEEEEEEEEEKPKRSSKKKKTHHNTGSSSNQTPNDSNSSTSHPSPKSNK